MREAWRLLSADTAGAGVGQQRRDADEWVGETRVAGDRLDELVNVAVTIVLKSVSRHCGFNMTGNLCH